MADKKPNTDLSPEQSLIQTIANSELGDLGVDLTETLIDQLLEEGFLRDLPIVGTVVQLAKVSIDIANYLFLKKTLLFLYSLKTVPEQQRRDFAQKLDSSEKLRKQVGENLLLALHRLDDMQKPALLGRVFGAYINGQVSLEDYQKLATAIDRIKTYSITGLIDFYSESSDRRVPSDETLQDLAYCGLVTAIAVKGMALGPLEGYTKNQLGRLFIEFALEENA
jgi:hypothetical protein